jgi:hypothetical protein
MNVLKRSTLFALTALILSLNVGVNVYRVHCNMVGETFVSLLQAYDPCLDHHEEEPLGSCCISSSHCEQVKDNHDDDSCCDEEEFTITYEPDFFQKFQQKALITPWTGLPQNGFSFPRINLFEQTATLSQYPQPPPLCGRDILTRHAVLRI